MLNRQQRTEALDLLHNARMQHTRWVAEVMNNELPQVEPDHRFCEFGRWLRCADEALREMEEFQALIEPHRELHEAYRTIKFTPGMEDLREAVKNLSMQLIEGVDRLERRLQQP